MKHAIFLMFGLCVAGCGAQEAPRGTYMAEGRLVEHLTTSTMCSYMFPDGSIAEYRRYSSSPCLATQIDELEAE